MPASTALPRSDPHLLGTPSPSRLRLCAGPAAAWLLLIGTGSLLLDREQVLVNLLLAPCLEETLLRHGLQGWLQARWASTLACAAVPAIACATVFAAVHLLLRPDVWSLATFGPALWIGRVYQRDRSLAACVRLHASFNLLWFAAAGPWLLSISA